MITNHQNSHPGEIHIQDGSVAEKAMAHKLDFNLWLQTQIHNAPWWGLSLAFHILLILFLASISYTGIIEAPFSPTEIIFKEDIPEPELPKRDTEPPDNIAPEKPDNPVIVDQPNPDDNNKDDETFDSISRLDDGKGRYDTIGIGPGLGPRRRGGPNGVRPLAPPSTEPIVLSGLIWLGKHQNPDGSWGAKSFQNQCRAAKCSGIGDEQFNIGLTGLSMLAFTGAGYTTSSNSKNTYEGVCFGDVVRKSAEYLTSIQLSDGTFGGVKDGKFMYNQAIATYALADLYALIMDTPAGVSFREPVERAVKYLLDVQNPNKAWRYQPKSGQNDTSVTGWVAMALKTAEYCNILVPQQAFNGIKAFLDDVTDKTYGKVGYTELGSEAVKSDEERRNIVVQPSLTAIGIMTRIFIDKRTSDPLIKLGVSQILSSLPTWDTSKSGIIDYYYWFYGSYCLNQYDGPNGPSWNKWNERMKDVLIKSQRIKEDGCAKGSWDPLDRWSSEASRVYCTAINVLTLEVYYRLPNIVKFGTK
jgi:hypothetical protein